MRPENADKSSFKASEELAMATLIRIAIAVAISLREGLVIQSGPPSKITGSIMMQMLYSERNFRVLPRPKIYFLISLLNALTLAMLEEAPAIING